MEECRKSPRASFKNSTFATTKNKTNNVHLHSPKLKKEIRSVLEPLTRFGVRDNTDWPIGLTTDMVNLYLPGVRRHGSVRRQTWSLFISKVRDSMAVLDNRDGKARQTLPLN